MKKMATSRRLEVTNHQEHHRFPSVEVRAPFPSSNDSFSFLRVE